jgi:2-octaprenylphenol hydroxylase
LVTTIKTEYPHRLTAWQCFHVEGVLALLPLSQPEYCSLVWSLKPARGEFLSQCDDKQFNQIISETFEHRLGKLQKCDRLIKFPLVMRHVKHYIRPRIALVGDAAHTIHPLAGQGVNLGLMDAACLAQIIFTSKFHHHDFGQYPYLRRFERWRKGDNWLMIMAMEIFKHLFASSTSVAIKTRKLGLQISDQNSFIKNQFIHHALGVKGDLPELAMEKFNQL